MADLDVKTDLVARNEADTQKITTQHGKKSSIDLSLELERELDALENSASDPLPLDPQVLSSLVSQLRRSVAELTQTRDDLVASLSNARAESAELRHTVDQAGERENELQGKVNRLEEQTQADRETINILRQKVEESRRGLMRLQTEHRRSSSVVQPLTLDLSKPGSTAKARQSLTGATGSLASRLSGPAPAAKGHRRFSSIAGTSGQEINFTSDDLSPVSEAPLRPLRKLNRLSYVANGELELPHTAPLPNQDIDDFAESLRDARSEIEQLKGRLAEAEEAREASDSCAKALKEFIEHHRIGEDEGGTSLQPMRPQPEKKVSGGWGGIKLWGSQANNKSSDEVSLKAPSIASGPKSPSMSPRSSMVPQSPTPTSRGLFGLNFLSQPKPINNQQDAMFNGSDSSSEGRRSMSPPTQVNPLPETVSNSDSRAGS
jgi:hypothetical protein